MSARGRRTIGRHKGMRPVRQGSGRIHHEKKAAPAGAFGFKLREAEEVSVDEASEVVALRKEQQKDDGAAYERFGEIVRDLNESMHEMRERTAWFPATPFMIVLLKELACELRDIAGELGAEIAEDISSLENLSTLNDLSGFTVDDILQKLIGAISPTRAAMLGLAPMSTVTKALIQNEARDHVLERAESRAGVQLSHLDLDRIIAVCRANKPFGKSYTRELHWLEINGQKVVAMFDRRLNYVSTFLTEDQVRRGIRHRMARFEGITMRDAFPEEVATRGATG